MEFVKVAEIRNRMCGSFATKENCCRTCQMFFENNGTGKVCPSFMLDHPKEAEEILIKWDKENPVKTYKTDFLEKFPNTILYSTGKPKACVQHLYGITFNCDNTKCTDCWNSPLGSLGGGTE